MEEISIKVNICDRFYPLRIHAGLEENVRSAAKLASDKAKSYSDNYSVQDKQDVLAMAALDLATDLIAAGKRTVADDNEITSLVSEISALFETTR